MKYLFKEKGLQIKFSFKERLTFFFTGSLKLNYFHSYKYSAILLKLVADATKKYGDGKIHGEVKEDKE